MTDTAELVARYAERFSTALGDGSHTVMSGLGGWLLLALLAPSAQDPARGRLEEVIGTNAEDAAARAEELIDALHPAVAAGLALWHRPEFVLRSFDDWTSTLPARTQLGPIPSQREIDEWARRASLGLIEQFPLQLDPFAVVVLASALAMRISWETPFRLVASGELGQPWCDRIERVLEAKAQLGHRMLIVATEDAGDVAVHAASAVEGVLVVSVIANSNVPAHAVHVAAHEVAALLVGQPSRAHRHSLFDLPMPGRFRRGPRTSEGHAWTLTEKEIEVSDGPQRQECFEAVLPAWNARGEHQLLKTKHRLGFDDAAAGLVAMCNPEFGPYSVEAKQSAVASFTRVGFEAAAITAVTAVSLGMPLPPRKVLQRTARLRFGRPYAVVAVALSSVPGQAGWPGGRPDLDVPAWSGVPLFSAWVAEPSEAE